jgi:hypothetical protein
MTRSHLRCRRPARVALCALYFLGFLASFCLFVTIIQAHAAQLTLAWDTNTNPAPAGYKLYWGTSPANYSWSADAGNQTTYAVPDLSAGATYYFAATAYDSERLESNFSNETTHTVPATCTYTVSPTSQVLGAGGGTGSINVTAGTTCAWTTSNPSSWVSITSGANGTGNGTVAYTVAANTGTASRTAGLTIAGRILNVSQAGAQPYSVTASSGPNGTISPSGQVSVANGANQSFTIAPATGYKVTNVLVDGSSVGAVTSYTFSSVTANHTITASFTASTYTLSITKSGSGSGTVTTNPSGTSFSAGTSVTLTATAGANSTFAGWSGGCYKTSTTCTVVMNTNLSVSTTFNSQAYTITATAGANGRISPSGSAAVASGASKTFTIAPSKNYTIQNVTVDGASVGTVNSYTFSNVTANHTIRATFTRSKWIGAMH